MTTMDGAEERPKTAMEMIRGAMPLFSWAHQFEDAILDYCAKRRPSGEVLWAKLVEWLRAGNNEEPSFVAWGDAAWTDLEPVERAAIDMLAAQFCALATVIDRYFPPERAPAVVVRAKPVDVEDTIFERHGSIAERDPHRVAAAAASVARIGGVTTHLGSDPASGEEPADVGGDKSRGRIKK